jgi:hypothetical protein
MGFIFERIQRLLNSTGSGKTYACGCRVDGLDKKIRITGKRK